MSSVAEASALLRSVIDPAPNGAKVKERITAAARALGWEYSRTKDVWYEDARRIDAHEMDCLREAKARSDADALKRQLLDLHSRLTAADPVFHRPTIDELERTLRTMGCEVVAVGLRAKGRMNNRVQNNKGM